MTVILSDPDPKEEESKDLRLLSSIPIPHNPGSPSPLAGTPQSPTLTPGTPPSPTPRCPFPLPNVPPMLPRRSPQLRPPKKGARCIGPSGHGWPSPVGSSSPSSPGSSSHPTSAPSANSHSAQSGGCSSTLVPIGPGAPRPLIPTLDPHHKCHPENPHAWGSTLWGKRVEGSVFAFAFAFAFPIPNP
jgi:hypothetical protein